MIDAAQRIDALAQDIAETGESWEHATRRALRVLEAVRACVLCQHCKAVWLDDGRDYCISCSCDHHSDWIDEGEPGPPPAPAPCGPDEKPCIACRAPAVPFGSFCAACYGEWLHPERLPMTPGDPEDPWREFNAEADALIFDRRMPAFLFKEPRTTPPTFGPVEPFDDEN